MNEILPARPVRYRPRMGPPTCFIETVLQWIWKWRAELMLAYIVAAITAAFIYEGVK